ncbi:MAG: sensor histidine kinase [Blautia sp.]|uniref:sensor histidine kinase n=1 Tax=unclassified Blautia TaxID=2648079 RepID=UPI001FD4D85E|nr:sensor histidine kinase [Blautia sp. NSJ-175]MCJ7844093.1 histidine kinase [Blautia sp. NSJ-175]
MRKRLKDSLWLQLIAFTALIMFFLLAAYAVTDSYSGKILRDRTIDLNDKILLQVEGKMEDFHDTLNHVATSMAYAPTTYDYFTMDPVARVMVSEDLSEIFSNTVLLESDIAGIYLYDTSLNQIAAMGKAADNPDFVQSLKKQMEFGDIFYLNQAGVPFYTVYFPVYDLNNRQYGIQTGMCVMMMRTDNLSGLLEDSQATENTQVFLLDGNNQIIASRGNNGLEELDRSMMRSTDEFYVKVRSVRMDGWKVVSRIPESEMNSSMDDGKKFVTIAYVLAFALLILLVWFCYKRFVGPLHQVDLFIQKIVDRPEQRMEIGREDEIGTVVQSLNHMLDARQKMNQEIQESQRRMYEAEIAKKQLQVLAYRNQINPHFLYNTFECICSMALYYEVDDIAEITMALSKVFRFAVKGENIVSVEEEVSYIREYAKIIDYRFMGKIDVDIEMEDAVKEKRVIKLMLQPLVENAVFHGLEQKLEDGEVNVSIHMHGEDHIMFVVEDNGCGIEPARLVWMRDNLDSRPTGQKGIGVANIYQRLKLFYGDDVVFQIESRQGEGTRITIIIPDELEPV